MLRDRDRALLRAQAAVRRWLRLDVRLWSPAGVADARRVQIVHDNDVSVVLDVGANRGQFALELRSNGYRGRIVSFEPLSGAYDALREAARDDPLWECRRLALSDTDGEAELHVSENAVSSSLLDMEARHVEAAPDSRYIATERVPQARLDALEAELLRAGDRVYLKLDIQGSEARALAGARGILARVVAIETELSLVPLYRDQLLLREMLDLLDGEGYSLVSLDPAYADPRNGHVLQVDGIFLRRGRDPSIA
jgi:FkbM family methyltransferase